MGCWGPKVLPVEHGDFSGCHSLVFRGVKMAKYGIHPCRDRPISANKDGCHGEIHGGTGGWQKGTLQQTSPNIIT